MKQKNETDDQKIIIKPIVALATAGFSFLLLVASVWWAGLACAVVSVILSASLMKKGEGTLKIAGLIGVILTLIACILYITMGSLR